MYLYRNNDNKCKVRIDFIRCLRARYKNKRGKSIRKRQSSFSIKQQIPFTSVTIMTTPTVSTTQPTPSTAQFATIQINDAVIKYSLYLERLTAYQQSQSRQDESKCHKLVRLMLQAFTKYSQTQEFSKQAYDMVKSCIIMKKSYYSLIVMDLMMKHNKHILKQVKKELEPMMRLVWEKLFNQNDKEINQSKIENLKVIIRCWGFIFGDKIEESLRKWLEAKYSIKKIELNEENEKALRQTYGEKMGKQTGKSGNQKESKLSQALINSLIDDDNPNTHTQTHGSHSSYHQSRESMPPSDPRTMYRHQTSFGQIPMMNSNQPNNNKQPLSSSIPNSTSQPQTKKTVSMEGMNKSLLEALDLS